MSEPSRPPRRVDADAPVMCPCNNDPFGNGPCDDCRDDMAAAKRRRAFAIFDKKVA